MPLDGVRVEGRGPEGLAVRLGRPPSEVHELEGVLAEALAAAERAHDLPGRPASRAGEAPAREAAEAAASAEEVVGAEEEEWEVRDLSCCSNDRVLLRFYRPHLIVSSMNLTRYVSSW